MASAGFLRNAAVAVMTLCAVVLLAGGTLASREGCRKHMAKVTEYGAVGDGKWLNTAAFAKAVADLSKHADDGGAALVVPRRRWLTGPFNLTGVGARKKTATPLGRVPVRAFGGFIQGYALDPILSTSATK